MPIKQKPFTRYNDDENKRIDTFTVKLNKEERAILQKMKSLIEQPKDSTCLKQLAWYAAKVLLGDNQTYLIETLFKNKRKNARLGIVEFE